MSNNLEIVVGALTELDIAEITTLADTFVW